MHRGKSSAGIVPQLDTRQKIGDIETGAFAVADSDKERAYEYCEIETDPWDSGVRISKFK